MELFKYQINKFKDILLTNKQLSEYFLVKPETISKWKQRGKIKPYGTINGRSRYRLEDLQHLIKLKP